MKASVIVGEAVEDTVAAALYLRLRNLLRYVECLRCARASSQVVNACIGLRLAQGRRLVYRSTEIL